MTAGLEQLDRLADIPLEAVFDETIQQHESDIVAFNKEQLNQGLDSEGRDLGQYSSIKYKGRLRPVDLLDTGAFRSSFKVDPVSGGFVVAATDSKTAILEKRYGPDITGVPDRDKAEISEWLKNDMIDEFRRKI